MDIISLGDGLVKLGGRNLQMVVGPKLPDKLSGIDVVALTQSSQTSTEVMVLDTPGEYEVGGILVTGIAAKLHTDSDGRGGVIYAVQADDVNVVILANVAPTLSNAQLEAMGQVDVLVIPVGGHGLTLDAPTAAAIVAQVEPKIVIPTHYDDGSSKYELLQDKVEVFLKELGATSQETTKYKLATKDLPEETAVVILKTEAK